MLEDRFGNLLTCDDDTAVGYYVQALDELFAMYGRAGTLIDASLAADPEFALAHCVKARGSLLEGNVKSAIESADRACELAAHATDREKAHAHIVAVTTRGDNTTALALVLKHVAAYPRDALPLSFALGVYGLLGFGGVVDHHDRQVALLESAADAWGEDWWFDAWLGWSYVEAHQVERGTELLDRSLDVRSNNATAAHGRAHAYYEAGDVTHGMAFIEKWLPSYAQSEPLHCHLAWHLGLFALQNGDLQLAQATYERYIAPDVSQALPMFTMIDCAAFQWRSMLYGQAPRQEWVEALDAFTAEHFAEPGLPFVNYHRSVVGALADHAFAQPDEADDLAPRISASISRAITAFGKRDYASAAASLHEVADWIPSLGGSNAQRDLIADTWIAALTGAGQVDAAQALVNERASRRAHHLDEKWYARML